MEGSEKVGDKLGFGRWITFSPGVIETLSLVSETDTHGYNMYIQLLKLSSSVSYVGIPLGEGRMHQLV